MQHYIGYFMALGLAASLSACSNTSATTTAGLDEKPIACNAFESSVDIRRLRIACQLGSDNGETGREAMLRFAADETLRRGFNWFRIYDRTEVNPNADRLRFRGGTDQQPDGGQRACDVFGCTNFGTLDITALNNRFDRLNKRQEIFIEIQLGSGQKPAGAAYYNAREFALAN